MFKPLSTLRQQLVAPKDKSKIVDQSGVVYRIPCSDCDSVYIGETARALGDRLKEHTSQSKSAVKSSAVAEHTKVTGHKLDSPNIKIVKKESKFLNRKIKESIAIRQESQAKLNRDGGRDLPRIYDCLLETPKSLKCEEEDSQPVITAWGW